MSNDSDISTQLSPAGDIGNAKSFTCSSLAELAVRVVDVRAYCSEVDIVVSILWNKKNRLTLLAA